MTNADITDINISRLASWSGILLDAHATPAVLIGIGHDHRSGDIHVVTVEDLTEKQLVAIMWYAIGEIRRGRAKT